MKIKHTLTNKYRKGATLREDVQPLLRHLPRGWIPVRTEVLATGHATIDGVAHEFQDLRVYLKQGVIQDAG